jgi:YHS domain-containing protein
MAIDPVCGMNVSEDEARYVFQSEDETVYFCSKGCKETYIGSGKPVKKGVFRRFLEKLAKTNAQTYGGQRPSCH